MTDPLTQLAAASVLFCVTHLGMSSAPVRAPLVKILGEWGFKGVYAVISVTVFTWMILAYLAAPEITLFEPSIGMRHASLTLVLLTCFLLVGGYTTPNPGIQGMERRGLEAGPRGVLKITRHPVMWGVAFWGIAHVLASGHVAALIFFGSLSALALLGAAHIDLRRRASHGADWETFEAGTSFWPLAAILTGKTRVAKGEVRWWQTGLTVVLYAVMLWGHRASGRDVLPMEFF